MVYGEAVVQYVEAAVQEQEPVFVRAFMRGDHHFAFYGIVAVCPAAFVHRGAAVSPKEKHLSGWRRSA